jgi:hypothetical protein
MYKRIIFDTAYFKVVMVMNFKRAYAKVVPK